MQSNRPDEKVTKPTPRPDWTEPELTTAMVSKKIANVIHEMTLIQRDHSVERAAFESTIRAQAATIRRLEAEAARACVEPCSNVEARQAVSE